YRMAVTSLPGRSWWASAASAPITTWNRPGKPTSARAWQSISACRRVSAPFCGWKGEPGNDRSANQIRRPAAEAVLRGAAQRTGFGTPAAPPDPAGYAPQPGRIPGAKPGGDLGRPGRGVRQPATSRGPH